jgi:hypothetical protein
MTKLTTIYLLGLLYLFIYYNFLHQPFNFRNYKRVSRSYHSVNIEEKKTRSLLNAYVFGNKKGLPREVKQLHKDLSLLHLFTPSGLHLTSFLIFFKFIFKRFKHYKTFELLLLLLPFSLESFFSLKRVALYRVLQTKLKFNIYKISTYQYFLLVFIFDFIIGNFSKSPLSYIYSFIFLGIIFSDDSPIRPSLIWSLFGGQLIIAYFQNTPILITGPFFGYFITSLFTLLFPFFLISSFLLPTFAHIIPIKISHYYLNLIELLVSLSKSIGYIDITINILLVVIILSLKNKKPLLIFSILILHSPPCINLPRSSFYNPPIQMGFILPVDKKYIIKTVATPRGSKQSYTNGLICYFKVFDSFYTRKCKWRRANSK